MEVKPFKAFRFNSDVVGNASDCIAPPYDVINSIQQENLYKKNPYNIARITKGKTEPGDNDTNNQYTRAAQYLNDWIAKGALKADSEESIYAYVQNFEIGANSFQRFSFIAMTRLEPFGKIVRPHEETLSEPKIDRLKLKRATCAKFGLVFMLYQDNENIADNIIEKTMAKKQPLLNFSDDQNVRHRLFAITDKNEIKAISAMMTKKTCIIADGHHRYETGLNYSKENTNPAAKYQMIAFSNTQHEGLVVLATHRLISNLENFDNDKLFDSLKAHFNITQYRIDSEKTKNNAKKKMLSAMKADFEKNKNTFGIYTADGSFYSAALRNKNDMDSIVADKSKAWRNLDVSVLHKLILEQLLGIDEKKLADQTNVEYIKDTEKAIDESIDRVDSGEKQIAFFLNPPKMEQIQQVADEGEKMPQKSTYFYPKIYTGLTVSKL